MEDPDKDSWAISEMELEYIGVTSTREDWHRGEYGDIPMYHAVPSPTVANEDDDRMLEGLMAEVSPGTEATLLRLDDTGKDQPTGPVAAVQEKHPTTKG